MHEAFSRGDAEAALDAFHPEVEWDGRNVPDGALGRGHQAILDHVAHWGSIWNDWTIDVERLEQVGDDTVIAYTRERGRSEAGVEMDERHAEVYVVRDGKIVRRFGFSDPAEALPALRASDHTGIVSRIFEGWARGDFKAGMDALDERVAFVVRSDFPEFGDFVGAEGVRQYMSRFLQQFEWTTIEAERVQAVGDTVLAHVFQRGRGTASGAETEHRFFMLFTFRGPRIVRIESIWHEREALEAVGL